MLYPVELQVHPNVSISAVWQCYRKTTPLCKKLPNFLHRGVVFLHTSLPRKVWLKMPYLLLP
ncbi:hypothetical protein [Cardinium endosymbiont of Oedothorax gibbosus]|uniref:hypothetical protein n=1 Tax=Cardinium endosymbiont of Oedothorax gibbosus TaxID=931101 RepID=UPI002024B6E0|nr:hypothetical protein [Cardinium endosymbiont of Oedothorax gibbosus]